MNTPVHLWITGTLSLVWNAFGALDYAATQLDITAYTDVMPEAMRDHLAAYPAWVTAVWALAVWLPLLGALLLLSRRATAAPVFAAALLAVLLAGLWNYVLSETPLTAVAGQGVFYFWIAVVVLAFGQWVYARAMARRGVLR